LLLHGFTGGPGSFAHLGLDAVAPELPGHGAAPDATSWEDALRGLEALLDPGPVVLAGYSMGARLALALAVRKPSSIARLVLESGTAGIEDPQERAQRRAEDGALADSIERGGVAAFVQRWEEHPRLASLKPFAAQFRPERLRHRPSGLASALRHLGAGAQPSYWAEIAQLRVPTVLLAGDRDPKFAALARRLHGRLPKSDLRLLDCGHAPHLERPQDFLGALR
jgi:2-succinyl-6-hydroxy-2,4-cyclohexadiene-1-carboxylate synthase